MLQPNTILSNRFKIKNKIGSGSFGSIYIAKDKETKKKYAVKVEAKKSFFPLVIYEANITLLMHKRAVPGVLSNYLATGFAKVYDFGTHEDNYYMVMDLLGPSLAELLYFCGNKFSLKTTLMIAVQMLTRL